MLTSYHVHSKYSDGAADMAELVRSANRLGLDELGISDHYTVMPKGEICLWSMPLDKLGNYIESIRQASYAASPTLKVLTGLEADYFPETVDELKERIAPHRFDYIIGSVHFVDGFPIDENAENWERLSQPERNDVIRGYWARITGIARSGIFSFAAHLDLYKKHGFGPNVDISEDIDTALDAIAAANMAVEVSTAGLRYVCNELYPSPEIIAACRKRNIPVLITADAHSPDVLVENYDKAREALRGAGYDAEKLWRTDGR